MGAVKDLEGRVCSREMDSWSCLGLGGPLPPQDRKGVTCVLGPTSAVWSRHTSAPLWSSGSS